MENQNPTEDEASLTKSSGADFLDGVNKLSQPVRHQVDGNKKGILKQKTHKDLHAENTEFQQKMQSQNAKQAYYMQDGVPDELVEDLETLSGYKTQYVSTLTNLSNRSEINVKMEQFYNIVDTIKTSVQEFNETNNVHLIKDVVSLYKKEMEPILKQLQQLKYKYHAIEYNEDDETYCLKRKIYTLNDMIVPFDEPNVISFDLGNNQHNKQKYSTKNSASSQGSASEEYIL
jgi:uncharacterized protein YbaR (Trm112 family)